MKKKEKAISKQQAINFAKDLKSLCEKHNVDVLNCTCCGSNVSVYFKGCKGYLAVDYYSLESDDPKKDSVKEYSEIEYILVPEKSRITDTKKWKSSVKKKSSAK